MKNFIIVDTWNGEGYSDSRATLLAFNTKEGVKKYCMEAVLNCVENEKNYTMEAKENCVSYTILYGEEQEDGSYENEDNGCYHFEEYRGQYAVIINPMINEHRTVKTKEDFDVEVKKWQENSWDADEVEELNTGNFDGNCFASFEDGDVIVSILPVVLEENDLEWYDSGDGVEYEIWKHRLTGVLYRIPIEIVRDFDSAEDNSHFKF